MIQFASIISAVPESLIGPWPQFIRCSMAKKIKLIWAWGTVCGAQRDILKLLKIYHENICLTIKILTTSEPKSRHVHSAITPLDYNGQQIWKPS
jgi:hypothetical protein